MSMFTIPRTQGLAGAADDFDEDHWRLLDKLNTKEEAQMRALQYPDMQRHCESHLRLLRNLSSFQFMLKRAAGFASNTAPLAFLQRLLAAHLFCIPLLARKSNLPLEVSHATQPSAH